MSRTLDLLEAAAFLKLSKEEVRRRARKGLIDGSKPGRGWVFLEEDLVAYIRSLYAGRRQAVPSLQKEAKCSTNVVVLTGLTSKGPSAKEFENLLAQRTKRKRRSSTTV